jgi:hypothetical protein
VPHKHLHQHGGKRLRGGGGGGVFFFFFFFFFFFLNCVSKVSAAERRKKQTAPIRQDQVRNTVLYKDSDRPNTEVHGRGREGLIIFFKKYLFPATDARQRKGARKAPGWDSRVLLRSEKQAAQETIAHGIVGRMRIAGRWRMHAGRRHR